MTNRALLLLALCSCPLFVNAFTINAPAGRGALPNNLAIQDMLWRMTTYFSSMVDTSTNRFNYLSLPQSGERLHEHCPIRDLGATWDATTALLFWSIQHDWLLANHHDISVCQEQLQDAVYSTLQVYYDSYMPLEQDDPTAGVALDSDNLLEPSNVAHSAFIILASIGALRLSLFNQDATRLPPINDLTRGILSMQRPDGAFRIQFGSEDVFRGIEFYPGEAMVALMDAHDYSTFTQDILDDSTRQAILSAMMRAFHFYADYYHQGNVDTNYNIWQVQAFTRLFYALHHGSEEEHNTSEATAVAEYVIELSQSIVNSRSWKELARGPSFYPNLQTVEIACGLDALAQGLRVALNTSRIEEATRFAMHAENAVSYLKFVQDQVPPEVTGSGGLGYGGVQVFEQRLDVTGHAISALTKILQVYHNFDG